MHHTLDVRWGNLLTTHPPFPGPRCAVGAMRRGGRGRTYFPFINPRTAPDRDSVATIPVERRRQRPVFPYCCDGMQTSPTLHHVGGQPSSAILTHGIMR